MIEKIKNYIIKSKFNNSYVMPALVLSIILSFIYNPLSHIQINSFNRILGNSLLDSTDISRRVANINFNNFVMLPVFFSLAYLFIQFIIENNKCNIQYNEYLKKVSIISLPTLILIYTNRYNENFNKFDILLIGCLICLGIIAVIINNYKILIDIDIFKWLLCASIPITLFVLIVIYHVIGRSNMILTLAVYSTICVTLMLFIIIMHDYLEFNALKKSYIYVMLSPIVLSIVLELINVLNQYSIIINRRFYISVIVYVLSMIVSIIHYKHIISKKDKNVSFCFENYYYPIIIVCFSFLASQLPLQTLVETEYFEQANHSLAVNELFKYGKIPIIETFDAHMLQHEISRILYGFINKDYFGALFTGYSINFMFYLLYYYLFKKFFDKDIALLLIIIFPITIENTFNLFPLAPLVILSFIYAYRKKTYKAYWIHWITSILACLFKLDMGFALTFTSISLWVLLYIFKHNEVKVKYLISSLISLIVATFIIFYFICFLKHIQPIERIVEFLHLCQSNINWGYSDLGNAKDITFALFYFIIPVVSSLLILNLVYSYIVKDINDLSDKYLIVIFIGTISIFNFSRGLVRHSLMENTSLILTSTTALFIAMYMYLKVKENRIIVFITTNAILNILFIILLSSESISITTLANNGLYKYLVFNSYNVEVKEKVDRVTPTNNMKQVYEPLKQSLDLLLGEDETYIDFTNQTLLYTLTGREKPMYVNQSPALLCDEYTQEKYIEQCESEKDKTTFVLMPISNMNLSKALDGINNSYRYYLVSEYINNNFIPLYRVNDFALWCRKDKYDEKAKKLQRLLINQKKPEEDVRINEKLLNTLKAENANLSIENSSIMLNSTIKDAKVFNMEQIKEVKNIINKYNYVNFSIEYESDKEGKFELFYTENGFTQDQCISKEMPKKGVFTATVSCNKASKFRFDIPDESNVKIKSITVKGENNLINGVDEIEAIDYNYIDIEDHIYDIGDIPYIWNKYDKIKFNDRDKQVNLINCNYEDNFSKINKEKGNYIYVNVSSQSDGSMKIMLGDKVGVFKPKMQYNFNLKQGENIGYIIRVSCDFMWYSNEVNKIQITSDNGALINEAYILKGDTIK